MTAKLGEEAVPAALRWRIVTVVRDPSMNFYGRNIQMAAILKEQLFVV